MQNTPPSVCGHPYTLLFQTFNDPRHLGTVVARQKCGDLPPKRPACETRVHLTLVDVVIITSTAVLLAFGQAEAQHHSLARKLRE